MFIIAEAGNCHEGDFEKAKQLVIEAAKAGADAVKFQMINPETFDCPEEKKEQYRRFHLSNDEYRSLKRLADKNNIEFMTTAFDVETVDFLNDLGVRRFKVASRDNRNLTLIRKCLSLNKTTIVSLGGIKDPDKYMNTINEYFNSPLIRFLRCIPKYPSNLEDIKENRKIMACYDGYSCHIEGLLESVAAACELTSELYYLEKHFTLDNNQSEFRDHIHALNPVDFTKYVSVLRALYD